ncbi:hypothetical protein MKY37_16480 [Psychrobacillus sp. FSL K6-2836]|uniref:hypothetical protein n=1 Tax=Psychrobacillus sp. FSL K6-2836 TaxID=2921548 RepID=UPI0030FC0F49
MKKKELKAVTSDMITAGIPTGITDMLKSLPPDFQTIVSLALPTLACIFNSYNRNLEMRDLEKLKLFLSDTKQAMEEREIEELKLLVNLDFPIEMQSTIEEIIRRGVNAKGKWLRKLAAHFVVIFGNSSHPSYQAGMQICLDILTQLNESDLKLLILYELHRKVNFENGIYMEDVNLEVEEVLKVLIEDKNVFAQTIYISSLKLRNIGLIARESSLTPYEDPDNKEKMIENFISLNCNEVTSYYYLFKRYINGFNP